MSKLLIVSRTDKSLSQLKSVVRESCFSDAEIITAHDKKEADLLIVNRINEKDIDLVIVNMAAEDIFDDGIAVNAARNLTAAVIVLVSERIYDRVKIKAEPLGIMVIKNPIDKSAFDLTLHISNVYINRLKYLKHKTDVLEAKVEEYKIINRAKWALIKNLHFTEEQAHKYIERQAMDLRMGRRDIAVNILKTYYNK